MSRKFILGISVIILVVSLKYTVCENLSTFESLLRSFVRMEAHRRMDSIVYTDGPLNSSIIRIGNLTNYTNIAYATWPSQKIVMQRSPDRLASLVVLSFESETNLLTALREIFPAKSPGSCNATCDWQPFYFILWPIQISKETEMQFINAKLVPEFAPRWLIDSNIFLLFTGLNSVGYLWEIYSIKNHNFIQEIKLLGNSIKDIDWFQLLRKVDRRNDFRQAVISGTAGYDPDYNWEAKFVENGTTFESGSAVSIYHDLRDSLNFKEIAVRGVFDTNDKEMTSLEKHVWNGEADLCISLLPLTLKTYKYLDFLHPMTTDPISAFFVEEDSTAIRDIVISSFSPVLWFTLLGTLFLFILLNNFILYLTTSLFRFSNLHDDFQKTLVNESFVWVVGTVTQQGWYRTPTSTSLRIVFFLGYFTGMVSYVAFSAAIVSKLSVTKKYIQDFNNLLEFEYDVLGDKDAAPYFSRLPTSLELGGENSGTLEEGIDLILGSQTAFLSYTDVYFTKALEINNLRALSCNVVSNLPATIGKVGFTFLIKKRSPFKEFLNNKVILLIERGLAQRYDVSYNQGIEASCTPSRVEQQPLDVSDLFTPYMIILAGFISSIVFFFLERFYFLRKNSEGQHVKEYFKKELAQGEPSGGIESHIFKFLGVRDPKTLWQIHRLD